MDMAMHHPSATASDDSNFQDIESFGIFKQSSKEGDDELGTPAAIGAAERSSKDDEMMQSSQESLNMLGGMGGEDSMSMDMDLIPMDKVSATDHFCRSLFQRVWH